jgi:hypothetical protein
MSSSPILCSYYFSFFLFIWQILFISIFFLLSATFWMIRNAENLNLPVTKSSENDEYFRVTKRWIFSNVEKMRPRNLLSLWFGKKCQLELLNKFFNIDQYWWFFAKFQWNLSICLTQSLKKPNWNLKNVFFINALYDKDDKIYEHWNLNTKLFCFISIYGKHRFRTHFWLK